MRAGAGRGDRREPGRERGRPPTRVQQVPGCRTGRAAAVDGGMRHAPCDMRGAACEVRHAICERERAGAIAGSRGGNGVDRRPGFSKSRVVEPGGPPPSMAACAMRHATCEVRHAPCDMRHARCDMRHATCERERAGAIAGSRGGNGVNAPYMTEAAPARTASVRVARPKASCIQQVAGFCKSR